MLWCVNFVSGRVVLFFVLFRLLILNSGLEVHQILMEQTSIAKAIYQAILKIRASHNRPHEENISKSAAKSLGLSKEQVKDHLASLVETGAVYISRTAKGDDSYFILNVNKLGVCYSNEPDGDINSGCGDKETDESVIGFDGVMEKGTSPSPSPNLDTRSGRSEIIISLDLI